MVLGFRYRSLLYVMYETQDIQMKIAVHWSPGFWV